MRRTIMPPVARGRGVVPRLFRDLKKRLQLRAWSRYLRLASTEHKLRYLFWEATLACNLACLHCGSDCSSGKDTRHELTTEEIIGGLESIAARYDPKDIMVGITGGEPLLRRDLFTVTGRIAALGFAWGMVTNGFAMTKEAIERCRATGMRTVTVSIDGLRDDHDWLRQNNKSFDRAVGAMRALRDESFLSSLEIATSVSRRIVDKLPDIYAFVEKEGVREWRLITLFPGGRARGSDDLLLRPDDYRKLYTFVRDVRIACPPMHVSVDEEGFLGCEFEREVRDAFYSCRAGIEIGGILAHGEISACPSVSRRLVQGNVRKGSFADCWENGFQRFRDRRWMRQGICKDCAQWWICQGNSLHLWNVDSNGPDVCHFNCLYGKERA